MTTFPRREIGWLLALFFALGGPAAGFVAFRLAASAEEQRAYVSSQLTSGPPLLGGAVTVVCWLLGGLGLAAVQRARDAGSRAQGRIIEAALRSLSEGFIVADRSGRFVLFNSAAERLLGMGRLDVGVASWSETYGCFYPDGRTPFPSDWLPLARALHGETSTADVFIRNQHVPDGVWIHIKGAPLLDERGRPDGGVVVFDDVSAARLGEERLRASVAESLRLTNAVEQTADTIIITNRSGTIEYVNPAFEATTGYSRVEAIGQTPRLLRSGKQPPEFHERLWKTILAGHVFRGSPVNRRKNGELYNTDQTITPIKDAEGRITHFVSVLKDATDRIRIEQQDLEMRYARQVQQRLFPDPSPSVPGLDVAGATFPALATCGDYYDFIPLENGALAVVTADVSGHGLGPALIMAQTRASLRILTTSCPNPCEVLTRMNATLHADLDENRYVALILAHIDPKTRRACYVNAGHPSAYHLDSRGGVKAVMPSCGPPLGMLPGIGYSVTETPPLEDGDVVVFLTDGITETENTAGEYFGADAAIAVVGRHLDKPAAGIVQHLREAAREFAGGCAQQDDITVVVCKIGDCPPVIPR